MIEPLPLSLSKSYDSDSLIYLSDHEFYYNVDFDKALLKDLLEHNFQIYGGTYRYEPEWKSPKIFLNGRGRMCGKKIFKIEGFLPYCYLPCKEGKYKTFNGEPVEKILFETAPKYVADLRKHQEKLGYNIPLEADVLYVRRFLIDTDNEFKPNEYVEPRIAIFDLETNYPINNDIIAFTINEYKENGELYHNNHYLEKDKYKLVLDAYTRLIDYDIVANWNIEFDLKSSLQVALQPFKLALQPLEEGYEISISAYIKKLTTEYNLFSIPRCERILSALEEYRIIKIENGIVKFGDIKLDTDMLFVVTPLNLQPVSKKMYGQEIQGRWSLDNTGRQLCGIGKIDTGVKYPKDMDEETLIMYNVMDAIIPEIIDNYLGGIQAHIMLSWSLQSLLNDTIITAAVNDIALLRAYHRDNIVLYSRPLDYQNNEIRESEDEVTYKAAEPDARPGVYKNGNIIDIEAAYASAVVAINASCETKDPNGIYLAPNGVRFNNSYSPFIQEIKRLMNERKLVKDKLQKLSKDNPEYMKYKYIDFAIKTQVAAFSHGIFGWEGSRMYDLEVADAITATVRDLLNTIKNYLDSIQHPWVYVHTDSAYFISTKEEGKKIVEDLNKLVEDYCKSHNYSITPHLDYKGFKPKMYIHSPARNVLVNEDGTWEVTGMAHIRSDMPVPLGNIEKKLISMTLDGASFEDKIKELSKMISDLKKANTSELGIIKPLSKQIKKYGKESNGLTKGIPYHIKALIKAGNEFGFKVKVGEKFSILPIIVDEWEGKRKPRRKKAFIAYPTEEGLPEQYQIDWDTYLQSNLYGKIYKLFNIKPKELERLVKEVKKE